MSEFYTSEIEPIDLSVFRRLVLSDDYRKAYNLVAEYTVAITEERIIKMLEPLGECEPSICGKGCRGEYRCIGWAYRHAIALIKGGHRHSLYVQGVPCDYCGEFHECCNDYECEWVEPCKPEGENK